MKVVLAAAMWNNPHLLVLDEPTNFLDRESLGALATAINEYAGGVIMISHNAGACRTCLAPPCMFFMLNIVPGDVVFAAGRCFLYNRVEVSSFVVVGADSVSVLVVHQV